METLNLHDWQERFRIAQEKYQAVLDKMVEREEIRLGTKQIKTKSGAKAKNASNVRKIAFELIESQVNSTIPQPKVTAIKESDLYAAQLLENELKNEMERLPFVEMNDELERLCPTQGGAFFWVEWDNTKHSHTSTGELSVKILHPRQVIPQPGVFEIDKMDYIFVVVSRTKEFIKRQYDVDLPHDTLSNLEVQTMHPYIDTIPGSDVTNDKELVIQVIAYYRNQNGGIGLYSWANDVVLEDLEDYQARRLQYCKECGAVKTGDVCSCGNDSFIWGDTDFETIPQPIITNEEIIPPFSSVPYYKPAVYPIIMRKNVSMSGSFLGSSDIDIIADQQIAVSKFGTKIEEKLLKGGSFVTFPKNSKFTLTDEELKVLPVGDVKDFSMIRVFDMQPNITFDLEMIERNYQSARSTLGITDSFQGKRDSSATSGRAKEISVMQSAGRLESKKAMKEAAFAKLYEVMAKFLIAYTDEQRWVRQEDSNGGQSFVTFSRYDFLKRDAANQLYYNDEFLFSVDAAAGLAKNRETMWQETRMNYQSGAFGDPTGYDALIMFWSIMEDLSYPLAAKVKKKLQSDHEAQLAVQAQQTASMQFQPQAMVQPTDINSFNPSQIVSNGGI